MYKRKFKKIVTIILVFGLIFSLTVPVDARRNKGRKKGKRINNVVNIMRTLREISRLTRPPAASTNCKFEKGDVILRRMGLDEIRAWTSATVLLVNPGLAVVLWRSVSQLSLAGHSGLYMEWEPDEKSNPAIKKNHKIIDSQARRGPGYDNFENFIKIKHFWGVRTSDKLNDEKRKEIVVKAESQIGKNIHGEEIGYALTEGYKSPGKSFRCDGLVEWAYETVGIDIIPNDWWCAEKGRKLLCARKQLDALDAQNNAKFPTLTFGKEDDEGEKVYGPIEIGGEEVEPDEDGKYKVYGEEVEVKIYASDIDEDNDGSGITRLELWVGEQDDTPDEMPGLRLLRDNTDYPADNDYVYTWDTTEKDTQGDPLFPNGDYTLKAIAFDQAGNTKEAYINVRVEELSHYFHVQLSPEYVKTGSPVSQTQAFTMKVQCYNYGTSVNSPTEGMVNKLSGTESWVKNEAGEWEKEKINPDCIAPEEWGKSDYNGDVSFGLNISGYELYVGGEKLETLELTNGTDSISGVVIKAEDGNIEDNHLFLIISTSDGTGSGNGALMVNPVIVNHSATKNAYRKYAGYATFSRTEAEFDYWWYHNLAYWGDHSWEQGGGGLYFVGELGDYWQNYRSNRIRAGKCDVVYNLSEQAIGYAPNEIAYAWMKAGVKWYIGERELRYVDYIGSIENKTTNEVGVLKTIDETYRYLLWRNIPVSDFGTSDRTYVFEPSISTVGTDGASQLKPEWPPRSLCGIELSGLPQILFIPKTEE